MVSTLIWILSFTFLSSIAGIVGGLILLTKEKFTKNISMYLVSFAAGALLAAAFLELLPEGITLFTDASTAFMIVLAGIVIFFIIERLLIWVHCHGHTCKVHNESKPYMLTISDTIHNFIDGVIVASSFLVSIPLGVATSIAIFFHEVPQEMGDFGALLHMGWKRKKIIMYNLISATASFAGAIITFFFAPFFKGLLGVLIMLAAGHLIYVSIADLIPELHKETRTKRAALQIFIMFLGIVLMWIIRILLE